MVLTFITLMVSFYSLATGWSDPDYTQLSKEGMPCYLPSGNGTCLRLHQCTPYVRGNIRFSDLNSCSNVNGINAFCCPMTVDPPKTDIASHVHQPYSSTTKKPNRTIRPILSHRSNIKTDATSFLSSPKLCNTTHRYKPKSCGENSPCFSPIGSGSCTRLVDCEPYLTKVVPYSNLSRCSFAGAIEIVCCPTSYQQTRTTENIPPSAPPTLRSTFVETRKWPNPKSPPISSMQSDEILPPSPVKPCNTVYGFGNGNCNEGSPCFSASENGTCKKIVNCGAFQRSSLQLSRCSFVAGVEVVCCPLTNHPSSQLEQITSKDYVPLFYPQAQYDLTTKKSNSITSPAIPLHATAQSFGRNRLSVVDSRRCSIGTCQAIRDCQPLADRQVKYSDLAKCGGQGQVCCPERFSGIAATSSVHNPLEGRSCSLKSGSGICTVLNKCQTFSMVSNEYSDLNYCDLPTRQLVCCPPFATVSEKPGVTTSHTTQTVRPAKKACENYKVRNPARLKTHDPEERGTTDGEFPHVGILLGPDFDEPSKLMAYCGVGLVSQRFALTAAQCVQDFKASDIQVNFGSVDIAPETYVEARIKNIWINDQYKTSEDYHDLALLEFFADVPLSQLVHPACLHVGVEDLPRQQTLQVNGWTSTDRSANYRYSYLYNSIVHTKELAGCNFTQHEKGISRRNPDGLHMGQYCARHAAIGECDGDPGFPLVIDTNGQFEIVGIMSKEFGCSAAMPSIYTRVGYYIDWIEKIVWPNRRTG